MGWPSSGCTSGCKIPPAVDPDLIVRVIVTGAGGLIGRHLLPRLLSTSCEVYATCRPGRQLGAPESVRPLYYDLLDLKRHDALFRNIKPDCLIHLAWCTTPGVYWSTKENISWLNATLSLVEKFSEAGGSRVLVAGTCAEYLWSSEEYTEGKTTLAPSTLYGAAKLATWQLLQPICREANIKLIWGRIFFPYGPGEHSTRLIPSVLDAMLSGDPVRCTHGRQLRDFIHADDVASAMAHLITTDIPDGAYNLSSGVPTSIRDIVDMCQKLTHSNSKTLYGVLPVSPDDPPKLVGANEKLIATGWNPKWNLQNGLLDYIDYLRNEART
ncbi:NAD(P)-dependent oxidoreductase [Parahaliea maris]|uniref:NAD(P)-dependent oxidoreductase n=1 Tax=Parahaliea maris TaxID=2716870 RepID=A0A5C9A954_9GAMM|nr:NAD(P)-dependent oxidoreductase [Parahaliea maris]